MNRNWKNLVLLTFTGTIASGCQNCQPNTSSVSRKPLGQRLFGSMGAPANNQPMPPYVPSSTLPGGLPPGAVASPPPGAVIIGANGQPINPAAGPVMGYPPSGGFPPTGGPAPSGTGIAPASVGPGTPFPPSGYSNLGATGPGLTNPGFANPGLAAPVPPAVSTNPPPSATGPLNSQSKRFSNEELQNSVRLGTPQVAESAKVDVPAAPSAPTTEPPLAPSNPNATGPSNPGTSGGPAPSATQTPSPLDIPRFIRIRQGLAVGRQPFPDGIVWLKDAGYRKVVHVAGPSEVDDAARKLFEREGIQYVRIELDPVKMDRATVQQFGALIRPAGTEQIFVFDRDGTRLGAAWLAERVIEEKADMIQAKTEADNIGLSWDRLSDQDPVKQNLNRILKPS